MDGSFTCILLIQVEINDWRISNLHDDDGCGEVEVVEEDW
jgi:hypothetical protein